MNDALYIAATGMHAHQKSVEAVANNLVNVNTPGFKAGKTAFVDLVYRGLQPAAAGGPELWQGSGVSVADIVRSFAPGELRRTEQALDLAIDGEGFIEVGDVAGATLYTRGGSLKVNADGLLATADGYPLKPAIHVGQDVRTLTIGGDGTVSIASGKQERLVEVGKIELVRFADLSGLAHMGGNLYRPTEHSGDAIYGRSGEDGTGVLVQGALETSNVKLIDEMVGLMAAQRAYESSVKVIQAADEMLAMSNNLRK